MKNMENTKNNFNYNSKGFRRRALLPFTALLLVAVLLSSPFVSIAWGNGPYTITYTFNMGGTNAIGNPTTYTTSSFGIPIADASDPVYKFQGWAVTYWANFTQILTPQLSYSIPAGTYGPIELTAVFDTSPAGFPITYMLDGGTNSPSNRDRYFGDHEYFPITIHAPTKLGYAFAGWTATYSDGRPAITVPQTSLSIVAGTIGAITLTAHWTPQPVPYTVHYYIVGTTTPLTTSKTVNTALIGTTVTENAANIPGYTADAPSKSLTLAASGNEITFFYTANQNIEYTVNYYLQGTTTSVAPSVTVTGQTMGASITESAIAVPGYTAVAPTSVTQTLAATGNVFTFYYIKSQFNIGYELNGGTNAPSNPSVYTIDDLPVAIANPSKAGYNFLEWRVTYANGAQSTLPAGGIPVGTTGDLTLTAVWDLTPITYSITYNLNGGTVVGGNPGVYNVENGHTINTATLTSPTLKGYNFLYWMVVYTNGTTPFQLTAAGIPAGSTGNVIISAVWDNTPAIYTITYDLDGGINASGNPTQYTVANDFPIPIHKPTKDGFTFAYWLVEDAAGGSFIMPASGIPTHVTGNLKLTAVWA